MTENKHDDKNRPPKDSNILVPEESVIELGSISSSSGSTGLDTKPALDSEAATLKMPNVDSWTHTTVEQRRKYLEQISANFHNIRQTFLDYSNEYVEVIDRARSLSNLWRKSLIGATGGLAVLNLFAAFFPDLGDPHKLLSLSLWAAVYAAVLTVMGNLESHNNYREKAEKFLFSRELSLDGHRTFEMLWHTYVTPFSDRPEACANARELYRRIVDKDLEIRAAIKDLSTMKPDKKA